MAFTIRDGRHHRAGGSGVKSLSESPRYAEHTLAICIQCREPSYGAFEFSSAERHRELSGSKRESAGSGPIYEDDDLRRGKPGVRRTSSSEMLELSMNARVVLSGVLISFVLAQNDLARRAVNTSNTRCTYWKLPRSSIDT